MDSSGGLDHLYSCIYSVEGYRTFNLGYEVVALDKIIYNFFIILEQSCFVTSLNWTLPNGDN